MIVADVIFRVCVKRECGVIIASCMICALFISLKRLSQIVHNALLSLVTEFGTAELLYHGTCPSLLQLPLSHFIEWI